MLQSPGVLYGMLGAGVDHRAPQHCKKKRKNKNSEKKKKKKEEKSPLN